LGTGKKSRKNASDNEDEDKSLKHTYTRDSVDPNLQIIKNEYLILEI
jgi:hypothetical protein